MARSGKKIAEDNNQGNVAVAEEKKPAKSSPKAKKMPFTAHMSEGSYEGTAMAQFHTAKEANDERPFQFGPGKARKLLLAIDENGADKVIALLRRVAEFKKA